MGNHRGRRLAGVAVAVVAAIGLGACSRAPAATRALDPLPADLPSPTTSAPAPPVYSLATARVPSVGVFDSSSQPEPARRLDNPQPSGASPGGTYPLRMLVVEDQGEWLKVLLPVRPNGSSGWIRRRDVDIATHDFRILVELSAYRITVWKGNEVLVQAPVGVGAAGRTPTAVGLFYTTELFEVVPAQRKAYGPYAFALSGFSEVLYSFGGGTGVLGIHGTSDNSSLGRDVSNGCIRMSNDVITKLAETLPLGVPVEIRA